MTEDTRETLLSALVWALILLVFFGSLSKARFPFFECEEISGSVQWQQPAITND